VEDKDIEQIFFHPLDVLMSFKLAEQHLPVLDVCVCACGEELEGRSGHIFVFLLNLKCSLL